MHLLFLLLCLQIQASFSQSGDQLSFLRRLVWPYKTRWQRDWGYRLVRVYGTIQ
jgi:hypothetical protein